MVDTNPPLCALSGTWFQFASSKTVAYDAIKLAESVGTSNMTCRSYGLFTLAKPWTHIAVEAPELVRTFETAEELAAQLDWTESNWVGTLETRRKAREWVHRNYSVDIPRKIFRDILSEAFPGSLS